MGERNAGNPHVAFDVAGAGDVAWSRGISAKAGAPVLDPTDVEGAGNVAWPKCVGQTGAPVLDPTAPRADLHGRVVDCSAEGFAQAMHVSCWSFIAMARLAEKLMTRGGALVAMSYYGADKVVGQYNMMGPVKAALQASVRYLAAELAPAGVRVFAVSPGPLKTRAASGIAQFDELIEDAMRRAPARRLVDIAEVGRVVAFLVGGSASGMTGDTIYVDAGLHHVA